MALHPDFWNWSLPERRAWFVRDMIVNYVPQEILPGDLVAGARFNVQTSLCLTREEGKAWQKLVKGKNGARSQMKWFHDHGYGNTGATSGHLIPGHERLLAIGSKGVHAELMSIDNAPGNQERNGSKGDQLRAMITASTMARDLASKYKILCENLAQKEPDAQREA